MHRWVQSKDIKCHFPINHPVFQVDITCQQSAVKEFDEFDFNVVNLYLMWHFWATICKKAATTAYNMMPKIEKLSWLLTLSIQVYGMIFWYYGLKSQEFSAKAALHFSLQYGE